MTRQIIASANKDLLSAFYIPLPGYPIACKIDNVVMLSELLFDRTALAFGKYDLVFCLQNGEFVPDPVYDTAIVTRTFCETIRLARLPAALKGAAEAQTCFSQPLHVHIRISKPPRLNLWDFLKGLIMNRTWVEAQVEGQIAVDVIGSREPFELGLEFEESLPQQRADTTVEQDSIATQQQEAAVDLEMLAEQVQKIINQRQGEKSVRDEAARQESIGPVQSNAEKQDIIPADQGEPELLSAVKVTELVLNILHTREAARAKQEQNRLQYPTAAECRETLAPHSENARYAPGGYPSGAYPDLARQPMSRRPAEPFQMSLEQIPSRPGLEAIIPKAPPTKPPEFGG